MTGKKPIKSIGWDSGGAGDKKRRRVPVDKIAIPEDEKQHLVAAAAYFRAARYRRVGADGCRSDDECAAATELEAVFKRHCISPDRS